MLNTAYDEDERPASPGRPRVAAHADTVLYFGCQSVTEVYQHLCARGWEIQAPMRADYGMWQVYTNGPGGFQLCFQHPVDENQKE